MDDLQCSEHDNKLQRKSYTLESPMVDGPLPPRLTRPHTSLVAECCREPWSSTSEECTSTLGGSEAVLSRSASAILADVTAAQLHDLSVSCPSTPDVLQHALPSVGYPNWAALPDDLLKRVLGFLPPSYLRVIRLVCHAWEQASGRFLTSLAPEKLLLQPSLSQRCPNLLSLDLSNCLNEVHCFRAKELGLRSMLHDHHLQSLMGLTRLTNLKLRGCSGLTSSGIGMLTQLTNLQKLDLSRCAGVDDAALQLMPHLAKLHVLLLAGCQGVSDEGLQALVCMQGLRHLNLAGCSRITNEGLQHLVQIHGLQRLNLDQCSNISDAGLVSLAALPSLRHVSVSWGSCVLGSGLQALAQLTSLQTLDISYITPVAPGSVEYHPPRMHALALHAPPRQQPV